ncbi:MAG: hypothetical protein JXO22_08335 [Phycisphaerae bacterium]|nr:hypothetical protein [Phycisphaerae bacterium]
MSTSLRFWMPMVAALLLWPLLMAAPAFAQTEAPASAAPPPAAQMSADNAVAPTAVAATPSWNKQTVRYAALRGGLLAIVGAVLIGIWLARRGRIMPLRDIAGLLVFEEAVSRATEMGRPTLFTCGGACDLKRVQLFASMPLLRRVAEMSGELGNRLIVPICYPETMPVHINTMKDGFADAGTIEAFRPDDVRFFPGGQFFFAIASMGWMLEERPATCFYFGYWEADSLLFAETGQTINAMQIAGTDQLYQVPFFVASCDYTIIGEEFWAASAKLSQDPHLLGSLGAQDVFKVGVLVLIVGGALLCSSPFVTRAVEQIQAILK